LPERDNIFQAEEFIALTEQESSPRWAPMLLNLTMINFYAIQFFRLSFWENLE
jgi:hypothetical protein